MSRTLSFVIDGEPFAWKRAERSISGHAYTLPAMRDAAAKIARSFQNAYPGHSAEPWEGRLSVMIDLCVSKRGREDIDNFGKIVLDALNGIAWKDDQQVDHLNLQIHRDPKDPRTNVYIVEMEVDSDGNARPWKADTERPHLPLSHGGGALAE